MPKRTAANGGDGTPAKKPKGLKKVWLVHGSQPPRPAFSEVDGKKILEIGYALESDPNDKSRTRVSSNKLFVFMRNI
jgi:hypothetical protein